MNCIQCLEQFAQFRLTQRFCSKHCYQRYYYIKNRDGSLKRTIEYKLFYNAKNRCNQSGLEFSIKIEDIKVPSHCPILNIKMIRKGRYAPSLDRIDPTKGYSIGNIWVISKLANRMKSNASINELERFATWVNQLTH